MAEIIAAVGAVSAFAGLADLCVKICITLNEMRETFVDAEGAITSLNADVDALASILRQMGNRLELSLTQGRQYSLDARKNLGNIINSCSIPLVGLFKVLGKFKDFSDLVGQGKAINVPLIRMKLRWVREEKRIEKIRQSLERQKSTLSVQLLVILVDHEDLQVEPLEQELQEVSISTAAAISDIPTPTTNEIAEALPGFMPSESPPDSSPDTSRTTEKAGSAKVPDIVLPSADRAEIEPTRRSSTAPNTSKNNVPSPPVKGMDERASSGRSVSRSPSPGSKRIPFVPSVDTLFSAIKAGRKETVLKIMQRGVEVTSTASDGTTPLQVAVVLNQEEIVLTLLFFGADPNSGGGYEVSPLIVAIGHRYPKLVKILLEAGANPSLPAVLHKAATTSVEMVKMCMANYPGFDYPIDINVFYHHHANINGETALMAACNVGKIDIARFLLEEAKADAAAMFKGRCVPQFRSALHASILRKDETLINLILTHIHDANLCNDTRYEPGLLHCAIDTGKGSTLQILVAAGVDVNVSFPIRGTALHAACEKGSLEMIEYLLQHHADPNIGPPDMHPITDIRCPLHTAISRGSIPMVNILLAAGADPEFHKGTLWLAAKTGNIEMVRRILEIDGLDINVPASDSSYAEIRGTALHIAAQQGHADVLRFLLREGADPNVKTNYLGTPLDVAIRNNHQDCVDMLLGGGDGSDDDDTS